MKLPKAFTTSRVTEALDSLATHIISARDIAASLKPAQVSKPNLIEEGPPRPIIKSVTPPKTVLSASQNMKSQTFTIEGRNFSKQSVKAFELFLESDPTQVLSGTPPAFDTVKKQFTTSVTVDRQTTSRGIYEVRIKDEDDAPQLPGFNVEVQIKKKTSSSMPSTPKPSSIRKPSTPKPPNIKTHPKDRDLKVNDKLALSVSATGRPPFQYQWLKDGLKLPSANSKEYKIPKVAATDAGNYVVIVGNSAGFVTGGPARVTVS